MAALKRGDAARLISPRTMRLHLHKGFTQLNITSRNEVGPGSAKLPRHTADPRSRRLVGVG
jgi:hypothetical protein